MFAKRFFQKAAQQLHQKSPQGGENSSVDLQPRVTLHYGIPSTSSVLAFDPIQSLLAVGTLDGRIKVVGGDNIEALLVSPKQLPFKYLQFLQNQGFLASISNDNDIQVWDLKLRNIACSMQWDSNVTAFSVIRGTTYMYVGDENGLVCVLKYDVGERKLIQLPYLVPAESIAEAAAISVPPHKSVVGVLPQPLSEGNRLLIAYEHGLIVLWDVSQNQAMLVKSCKDIQLKDQAVIDLSKEAKSDSVGDVSEDEQMDKDISSLCWASSDGSIVAVGYVDGDIMLWNLSSSAFLKSPQAAKPSNDSVKLQLSSSDRRLPVIILHWSAIRERGTQGGKLFVYGGAEIGSEEVLTILNLDWSRGIQNVKCVGRTDITLNGSFADMVLVPPTDEREGVHSSSPLILTNPGQLHFYDEDCLSALFHQERRATVSPLPYEMAVPTVEPQMTVSKLGPVPKDEKFSESLYELVQAAKRCMEDDLTNGDTRWPIYGGIPNRLPLMEDYHIERIYAAGYRDGSVRLWDATSPALSQIYVLEPECLFMEICLIQVKDVEMADANAAVSALDICSINLYLAVGNEFGLVRLYNLAGTSDPEGLRVVSATVTEVHEVQQEDGPRCIALFSLLKSPIRAIDFANSGTRLLVGFESGQVAVIDTTALSLLNLTDAISSSSAIISLCANSFSDSKRNSPGDTEPSDLNSTEKSVTFVLTEDVSIAVLDSAKGNLIESQSFWPEKKSTAISLNLIEGNYPIPEVSGETHTSSSKRTEAKEGPEWSNIHDEDSYCEDAPAGLRIKSYALLCCEDSITLYALKSPFQIDDNFVQKVDLVKPCSWTMILRKDERDYALVVLYQTGELEIRSLPNLEVICESSFGSLLRWSFKTNMDKTLSFTENGQITLVNGCEFACISLLASENNFRIPQSLPCLHDEVLAAAADASINSSLDGKKSQGTNARGLLDTVLRSLEGKGDSNSGLMKVDCTNPAHLDSIFSKPLSLGSSTDATPDQEVIELNIDDIHIDGPVTISSSYQKPDKDAKADIKPEKERLFEGSSTYEKPRMRTREEIVAKYRKTPAGDAHAAASQARDKLAERGEKLEKMRERTEELQDGAQDFASMAGELARRMENRKWWNMF
ncbi:uncharacterized protein LOC116188258 isoform X3 [Punica granatum]|uniref:Uncharacterized protein LOC116188258 isoform X3 n=1 Tax=Punica granatum TaxID=22663 RepID=A0A6P8BRE4_PUNGR|nr:uncharacterized protein LOC116188258 isoform X3 [Punica granatum]